MIKTSPEFQAAIVGSPRRIEILAVVDISDPDMIYKTATGDSVAPWAKLDELHDKIFDPPARYATLERNLWLLDGSFKIFPPDFKVPENMGDANNRLCDQYGVFNPPAWVEQGFENVEVLQAFSIFFSSAPEDGVPMDFTVEVLSNGQVHYTKEFVGNHSTEISVSGFTVHNPDAIRIQCTKWSLPLRRMRIMEILPGIYERWTDRMLASFTATLQGDFSCMSLPYGTVNLSMYNQDRRFDPRNKKGLFESIEERQGIDVYIGVKLPSGAYERCKIGTFYQAGDGWKTSNNSITMNWALVDIIGLLTARTFIPPTTLPTTLDGWLEAITGQLGSNFSQRYTVDPNYAKLPVTCSNRDSVTGKTCGDILRWVCQATGTWPRADAGTGFLTAEPLWNEGNSLTLNNLNEYPTMSANKSLAMIIFELTDGTKYLVSGNSASSENTVTVKNPFLHTQAQAQAAARLILACYGGNILDTVGRGDPSSEIGDVDTVWLDEGAQTTGRRMMQTFNIQSGVLQRCQTRLLQADGAFLWENGTVITADGSWTAPAGVNELRVVLVGGGNGGMKGQDGDLIVDPVRHKAQTVDGEHGDNGSGGKVFYATIPINDSQVFNVTIGRGGTASSVYGTPGTKGTDTLFGTLSSASGRVYENGYTDIANWQTYARTGVVSPQPGSGDGGAGGQGGAGGIGEWTDERYGKETIWTYQEIFPPQSGQKADPGADGCVVVFWEKSQETAALEI